MHASLRSLSAFVDKPCLLARRALWAGDDPLGAGKHAAQLLRSPAVGSTMTATVDGKRWLETTPVLAIDVIESAAAVRLVARTAFALYTLDFDRAALDHSEASSGPDSRASSR